MPRAHRHRDELKALPLHFGASSSRSRCDNAGFNAQALPWQPELQAGAGAACIRDPNRGGFRQKTPVPHRPPSPAGKNVPSREGRGGSIPQHHSRALLHGSSGARPQPLGPMLGQLRGLGLGQRPVAALQLQGWEHEKQRVAPVVVPALVPKPQPFPQLVLLCRDNVITALGVSVQSCLPPPRPVCWAGSTPLLSPLPKTTTAPQAPPHTQPHEGENRAGQGEPAPCRLLPAHPCPPQLCATMCPARHSWLRAPDVPLPCCWLPLSRGLPCPRSTSAASSCMAAPCHSSSRHGHGVCEPTHAPAMPDPCSRHRQAPHLPFFRTTSSDSGLRLTETTFITR